MPRLIDKKIVLLSCVLALAPLSLPASDNTLGRIFKFQQAMAAKGQAAAQYKLAMMFETGDGTAADLKQARHWYQQASQQGYKAASHRLKYLELKPNQMAEPTWIAELQRDANTGDGETLFLLGQMHAAGIGISKNLSHAAVLLRRAAAEDVPGSEAELTRVEQAIEQQNADRALLLQQEREATQIWQAQEKARVVAEQARIAAVLQQKQKLDAQALQRQAAAEQTTRAVAAEAPAKPVVPILVTREVITPTTPVSAVTEVDLSPCSGRNRFAATCR